MALQPIKPNFKQHVLKNISPEERPAIHHFEYDDETARLAAGGFTSSDLWRIALQKSDTSLWILVGISPVVWKFVGGADDSPTATATSATATSVSWDSISGKPSTRDGYGISDVYTKTETESLISGISNLRSEIFTNLNIHVLTLSTVPNFIISLTLNGVGMHEGVDYTKTNYEITISNNWDLKINDAICVTYF